MASSELKGRVVLVTGGTAGLGNSTVEALAIKSPSKIIFGGRNTQRAERLKRDIESKYSDVEVHFVLCDLASFTSVRIDVLVCNAGIMAVPPGLTADGYEIQFGTNFLGHALLVQELLPALKASASPRVVFLTSLGFTLASTIDFDTLRTTQAGFMAQWTRYGQSKLAAILYARRLAVPCPELSVLSIHHGIINTDLVGSLGFVDRFIVYATSFWKMVTPEEGVKNSVWASTVQALEIVNGGYYKPVGKVGWTTVASTDERLAESLWSWTQEQCRQRQARVGRESVQEYAFNRGLGYYSISLAALPVAEYD